eukprot:gene14217-biopygen6175
MLLHLARAIRIDGHPARRRPRHRLADPAARCARSELIVGACCALFGRPTASGRGTNDCCRTAILRRLLQQRGGPPIGGFRVGGLRAGRHRRWALCADSSIFVCGLFNICVRTLLSTRPPASGNSNSGDSFLDIWPPANSLCPSRLTLFRPPASGSSSNDSDDDDDDDDDNGNNDDDDNNDDDNDRSSSSSGNNDDDNNNGDSGRGRTAAGGS